MAVYGSSFPGPEGFIEAICSTMLASNKYNLQHNACFQYVQSAARCLHTSNDYVNGTPLSLIKITSAMSFTKKQLCAYMFRSI